MQYPSNISVMKSLNYLLDKNDVIQFDQVLHNYIDINYFKYNPTILPTFMLSVIAVNNVAFLDRLVSIGVAVPKYKKPEAVCSGLRCCWIR